MGNTCSECQHKPSELDKVQSTIAFAAEEETVEELKEVKEEVQELKGVQEEVQEAKEVKEEVEEVKETQELVDGTKEAVVVAEVPAAPAPCAPPVQLTITFLSVAGKESEMSFKTQPLPFQCKPQAKGGCCASGTTGKVVVAKVDAKKAKEFYDLKAGMIIYKVDGCDLLKDQDFPEFQKMLAEKTKDLLEEPKEALKEVPKEAPKEAPKEEPKEAPVEAPTEEVKDTPKEEVKDTPKEEVKDTLTEEVKDTPKEEVKDTPTEEVKDAPTEEVKDTPKEEATQEPKEGAEETCK